MCILIKWSVNNINDIKYNNNNNKSNINEESNISQFKPRILENNIVEIAKKDGKNFETVKVINNSNKIPNIQDSQNFNSNINKNLKVLSYHSFKSVSYYHNLLSYFKKGEKKDIVKEIKKIFDSKVDFFETLKKLN